MSTDATTEYLSEEELAGLNEQIAEGCLEVRGWVADKAGPEVTDQFRLVCWAHRKIAEAARKARILMAPLLEELEQLITRQANLQNRLTGVMTHQKGETAFLRSIILNWADQEAVRAALGKTIPTPFGEIRTRQGRGKTEVNEDLVMQGYRSDPQFWAGLVRIVESVNKDAVRERFESQGNGQWLDKETGEISDLCIIREVEPPTVKVEIVTDEVPGAQGKDE